MKKAMVLFLMMGSMSAMTVAMNENDRKSAQKYIQPMVCCPRSFAVPPCEKCFKRRPLGEKASVQAPQPLSSSQEMERPPLP